jgi:hypothetical protein
MISSCSTVYNENETYKYTLKLKKDIFFDKEAKTANILGKEKYSSDN